MLFKHLTDSWLNKPYHHDWLEKESRRLMSFYRQARHPDAGFAALDNQGKLADDSQPDTMLPARMSHSFANASIQRQPRAGALARCRLPLLLRKLRHSEYGCWLAGLPPQPPHTRSQA